MSDGERGLGFLLTIIVGGLIFGFGLGLSNMARPEVVLDFLQFDDFGLVFVMGGAAVVTGTVFALAEATGRRAPLTGIDYGRRLKSFDKNVVTGGVIFGAGWGISGICPGAAYASLGVGNYPILVAIGGMFLGAYLQGLWRARRTESATRGTSAD
ncbi:MULTISPECIES: YeeE/YedE family protein [Haloferax]|uniref:YeeE/YedE family protein n=1 Tax=Haloferax marinum TaxID=2666143 RepID=A0A6A8G4X3_9EURY|nr:MULTISPECIES: DUF6691 family protein [Haloferax]KAB1196409.1 YeeE/YedE family protein [Haloferax sp. CBA1150]MRW95403.1 YeeE/YedE family protein [Haloferax marinum]